MASADLLKRLAVEVRGDTADVEQALRRVDSLASGLTSPSIGLDTSDLEAGADRADASLDEIEGTADLGMDGTDVDTGAAAADALLDGIEGTADLGLDMGDVEGGADAAGSLLDGIEGTALLGLDMSDVEGGADAAGSLLNGIEGTAVLHLDASEVEQGADGATGAVGGLAGAVAGLGLISLAGGWLADVSEAQSVMAVTTQLVEQTGASAWITADQIGTMSGALQELTGVSDEAIQGAQNILLSFRNVQNQGDGAAAVFDRATASALDMSTVMGGDVTGAAMQLGKALEDPVRGMAALSRSGVTFTAEQREMIEAMVANGDALGAQTMLLDEVERTMGGAAEAARTPMAAMSVTMGELSETLGAALMPAMEALTPIISSVAGIFTSLPGPVQTVIVVGALLAAGVVALSAVFATFSLAAPAFGAALTVATGPIGMIVIGIAGLIAIGIALWQNWDTVAAALSAAWGFITETVGAAVGFIGDHIGNLGRVVLAFATLGMSEVVRFIAGHWGAIVDAIGAAVGWITGHIGTLGRILLAFATLGLSEVVRFIAGHWGAIVEGAGNMVGGVIDFVTSLPGRIVGALADLNRLLFGIGREAIDGLWDGLQSMVGSVIDFASGLPGQILGALGDVNAMLVEVGRDIIRGLWSGLQSMAGWIADRVSDLVTSVIPGPVLRVLGIGSPSKVMAELGGYAGEGLALGLMATSDLVASAAEALAGAAIPEMAGAGAGAGRFDAMGSSLPVAAVPLGAGAGGTTTVVNVTVEGSVWTERDLTEAVRSELIRTGQVNGGGILAGVA